jgi:hypothetical protein
MELSTAVFVYRPVSVGETTMGRGDGLTDRGSTLIRGLVVGNLLWVVVIAFLFAVITGVFG